MVFLVGSPKHLVTAAATADLEAFGCKFVIILVPFINMHRSCLNGAILGCHVLLGEWSYTCLCKYTFLSFGGAIFYLYLEHTFR